MARVATSWELSPLPVKSGNPKKSLSKKVTSMVENFLRVDSLDALQDRRPTFLAIGVFDGVHLGHQQLLSDMVAAAQAAGARPAVLTFFPHPMVVIRNLRGRIYLTTLSHRVTLLSRLGIELVVVHQNNDEGITTSDADI